MGNSESTIRKNLEGRPTVVIVGGGYGGVAAAKALDSQFNVLLIDRKNYFFHNIGALRASVQSSFAAQVVIPYDKLLKYGNVVQAEVLEISSTGVLVHGRDEPIKFDYLIIATGTSYAFPCKVAEPFAKELPSLYAQTESAIKEASEILIIGGGPVGVELLGEITHLYPEKKVKLIHRQENLIVGKLSDRFKDELKKRIQELPNVELILGDEVLIDEETKAKFEHRFIKGPVTLETKKGLKITTDLAFFCGGSKINNGSLSKNFGSVLNEAGRLKVNKHLQVDGYTNIFAIGDCAGSEVKTSMVAAAHADIAAKNISLHHAKKTLKEFIPGPPMMLVPLGPKKGAGQLPMGNMVVGHTITSMIKGGTLFAPMFWGTLNQKAPDAWQDARFEGEPAPEAQTEALAASLKISKQDAADLLKGLQPVQHDSRVDFI